MCGAMPESPYEAMRMDPGNWKLGLMYYCRDDPRLVVYAAGQMARDRGA